MLNYSCNIYSRIFKIQLSRMAGAKEHDFSFREVKGDLFSCDKDASLAHCVSADLRMGKGIATTFKTRFGGVNELRSQSNDLIFSSTMSHAFSPLGVSLMSKII